VIESLMEDRMKNVHRIGRKCKRYHKRGPLAIPKVSHFPQESALLERKFEQSGGKERCIPWHFQMKFAPGS
jgi:hypothetical protein